MPANSSTEIYSATYSNVPVYEFNIEGSHVMRRRSDDWINATHILKVAKYDKPTRTRILEREVQKGTHEKVQGGYGKYQGTWISLEDGRDLAAKNGVLNILLPILDFVPGDRTPPQAPKHVTAASNKPRQPRAAPQPRRQLAYENRPAEYEPADSELRVDHGTPDNTDLYSESAFDEYDNSQFSQSRKRRRVDDQPSQADREHHLWAEELLDYFMFQDNALDAFPTAPIPPATVNLDRPIDDKGHTAIHWAAAMGDVEVMKDLIRRGAKIDVQSKAGETPLMRAVLFTNSFDRQNMDKLASLLVRTVNIQEWTTGSTVFHHIANTTQRKSKYACARYYMESLLNKLFEMFPSGEGEEIINCVDVNGDTAITIAARNGARRCVRSLISRNASMEVVNKAGETADRLIVALNNRRQERLSTNRQLSSSPFQPDGNMIPSIGGTVQAPNGIPFDLSSQAAMRVGGSGTASEVYKSESALTVTSQIMPSFFEKARNLAATLEAEISEKDAEYQEAERLASMRRAELDELRSKHEELRLQEQDQVNGNEKSNDDLLDELEQLMQECHALTVAEENQKLIDLWKEEEAKAIAANPNHNDDDGDGEEVMREKLQLSRELAVAMNRRSDLINEVVQAASEAGVGDKHVQYHRLLAGCLNLREEDIQSMLPEIVEELQQYRELEAKGA